MNICRTSEVVALVSLSTTFFLFIHTRELATRLAQVKNPCRPYQPHSSLRATRKAQGKNSCHIVNHFLPLFHTRELASLLAKVKRPCLHYQPHSSLCNTISLGKESLSPFSTTFFLFIMARRLDKRQPRSLTQGSLP